jgi:hypothetical protein
MSLEKKQGYLDEFREILEVRAGDWLDVADLIAEAERVKSGAQQDGAEEREGGEVDGACDHVAGGE